MQLEPMSGMEATWVTWSPDGRWLVGVDAGARLHVADLEVGNEWLLTTLPVGEFSNGKWAPDGSGFTAWARRDLMLLPFGSDGPSAPRTLATFDQEGGWLEWSSDGEWLAFIVPGIAGDDDLYFVDALGAVAPRAAGTILLSNLGGWASGAHRFAILRSDQASTGNFAVEIVDIDDDVTRSTVPLPACLGPVVPSHDGTRFYYVAPDSPEWSPDRVCSPAVAVETAPGTWTSIDLPGGTTTAGLGTLPVWVGDSPRLAFQADVDGVQRLMLVDVDLAVDQPIDPDAVSLESRFWPSPDGSRLAYLSSSGALSIATIAEDLPPAPLHSDEVFSPTRVRWYADGGRLAAQTSSQISAVVLDGSSFGQTFPLGAGDLPLAVWSATGEYLAFERDDAIYIAHIDDAGVPPATVTDPDFADDARVRSLLWSPTVW